MSMQHEISAILRQNYTLPAMQYGDQSEAVFVLRPVRWTALSNLDAKPDNSHTVIITVRQTCLCYEMQGYMQDGSHVQQLCVQY